jgi:hypothetical protein
MTAFRESATRADFAYCALLVLSGQEATSLIASRYCPTIEHFGYVPGIGNRAKRSPDAADAETQVGAPVAMGLRVPTAVRGCKIQNGC